MSHVGNDIVDLKAPEAMGKSEDIRFIKRVLTPCEQRMLHHSEHPDTLVWALWAAKETAFKAVSKSYPNISSAPGRYPVILDSKKSSHSSKGEVMTPNGSVEIRIDLHEDYIHCIGIFSLADNLDSIVSGIGEIDTNTLAGQMDSISEKESFAVRRLAKKGIASCLHVNEQDIQIIRHKKAHPPTVLAKGKMKNMEISLSHDGRFAAYAFLEI